MIPLTYINVQLNMNRSMNKILFSLLMIFTSAPLYAQLPEEIQWKHLVKTYTPDSTEMVLSLNGKTLNGAYKIPFEEGGFALYNIKNGMIGGTAFWYSNAGNVECKLNYKRGVRNGLKENYDSEGKVWLRQEYKDGRQDGINEMYSNGKLVNKADYKNGKKHGWSYTYTGEQVMTESHYENGMQNGLSRNYMNGKVSQESNFKDDKRHGLHIMYVNGNKNMDFMYENGEKHGVSHMYKPDGTVLFEHYYLSGQKVNKDEFEKLQQSNGNKN